MKNKLFQTIRVKAPKRNLFDLSHERKQSMKMGFLYPIFLQDVVPGDKFRVNSECFLRFAPLISPVMHSVNVYVHYFFVPMRLVWDNWEDFITGGKDGLQAPVLPCVTINSGFKNPQLKGNLPDYFGLPVWNGVDAINNDLTYSILPFRAYSLIFNEYYIDRNLSVERPFSKGDTVEINELSEYYKLARRAWEKDYFTSALPWTQLGAEVVLPNDPVYKDKSLVYESTTDTLASGGQLSSASDGGLAHSVLGDARIENIDGIDITINELRRSVKLQEWLEKNARGGSRYIEQILSHFGVKSSDSRLQRPEYLGGGKQPVVISEVLNTSDTESRPQGSMAGHGISVGNTNRFSKYFEEHGYVMGLVSVLPRTAYQQGVPKHFLKNDKLDFYWPEFAHLGEQPVINSELYHNWKTEEGQDPLTGTFGYQSRYAEYKFINSSVHGDFRDNLSFWHLGRIFASQPKLNQTFIESDPSNRVFAVENQEVDNIYMQIYNNVKALRPMPIFGSPLL